MRGSSIGVSRSGTRTSIIPGVQGPQGTCRITSTKQFLEQGENLELDGDEFDESEAHDIVLEAGQVSLHDVYLYHGSEPNQSDRPRRAMTLRYMPTTSVFDRELADQQAQKKGFVSHSSRNLYLMRGGDRSGKNDFRMRL